MARYGAEPDGRTCTPASPLPAPSVFIRVYLCYRQGVMAEGALSCYFPAGSLAATTVLASASQTTRKPTLKTPRQEG